METIRIKFSLDLCFGHCYFRDVRVLGCDKMPLINVALRIVMILLPTTFEVSGIPTSGCFAFVFRMVLPWGPLDPSDSSPLDPYRHPLPPDPQVGAQRRVL